MRSLEFRLYPTEAQAQQLESWLDLQRRIWDYGLGLLHELNDFMPLNAGDKAAGVPAARYPACPLPWKYSELHPEMDKGRPPEKRVLFGAQPAAGEKWIFVPRSRVNIKKGQPISGECPLPRHWRQPRLWQPPRLTGDSLYTLQKFFAKKGHPDWAELQGCPTNLVRGTLQALSTAWKESRSGKRDSMGRRRKPPRFKGKRFPLSTLNDLDAKGSVQVKANAVKLPRLGWMRLMGNRNQSRWPADREVATYRIQRKPDGWYLLLVGRFDPRTVRTTDLKVGLDAGVVSTLTTSTGKQIKGPAPLQAALRKLERLQQQLARQQKGSANWQKTKARIARLHEKIRRTRKLFAHKVSTYLLRTYGAVVLEDLKLQNMTRSPEPKPNEDGSGHLPNGAAAKAGLNRRILDQGLGQIRTLLETKGKDLGRDLRRTAPHHTSQKCCACGHVDKANRVEQAVFHCVSCGHVMNADHNAAINILRAEFPDEVVPLAPIPLEQQSDQMHLLPAPAPATRRRARGRARPRHAKAEVTITHRRREPEQQLALF